VEHQHVRIHVHRVAAVIAQRRDREPGETELRVRRAPRVGDRRGIAVVDRADLHVARAVAADRIGQHQERQPLAAVGAAEYPYRIIAHGYRG
jgi:hypothetical protein